jgi:hypothetical protein
MHTKAQQVASSPHWAWLSSQQMGSHQTESALFLMLTKPMRTVDLPLMMAPLISSPPPLTVLVSSMGLFTGLG